MVEKWSAGRPRGAVRPFHLLVVLALSVATVFAGSYCELGAWKAAASPGHSCCAKPESSHAAPTGYSECCALTAAPVPAPAMAPATSFVEIQPAFRLVAQTLPVEPQTDISSSSHPPPAHFVAFVLRRSLPAHAPPSFVA